MFDYYEMKTKVKTIEVYWYSTFHGTFITLFSAYL